MVLRTDDGSTMDNGHLRDDSSSAVQQHKGELKNKYASVVKIGYIHNVKYSRNVLERSHNVAYTCTIIR